VALALVLGALLGFALATRDAIPRLNMEMKRLHEECDRCGREKFELHERLLGEVRSSGVPSDRPKKPKN